MTFQKFLQLWIANGGTQKGLGLEIGICEQAMSRLVHKKKRVGLKMLKRMRRACKGKVSMGELMEEYRPDIYNQIMQEGEDGNCNS